VLKLRIGPKNALIELSSLVPRASFSMLPATGLFQPGTFTGEHDGCCSTDAGCGTCNECYLILQQPHFCIALLCFRWPPVPDWDNYDSLGEVLSMWRIPSPETSPEEIWSTQPEMLLREMLANRDIAPVPTGRRSQIAWDTARDSSHRNMHDTNATKDHTYQRSTVARRGKSPSCHAGGFWLTISQVGAPAATGCCRVRMGRHHHECPSTRGVAAQSIRRNLRHRRVSASHDFWPQTAGTERGEKNGHLFSRQHTEGSSG